MSKTLGNNRLLGHFRSTSEVYFCCMHANNQFSKGRQTQESCHSLTYSILKLKIGKTMIYLSVVFTKLTTHYISFGWLVCKIIFSRLEKPAETAHRHRWKPHTGSLIFDRKWLLYKSTNHKEVMCTLCFKHQTRDNLIKRELLMLHTWTELWNRSPGVQKSPFCCRVVHSSCHLDIHTNSRDKISSWVI